MLQVFSVIDKSTKTINSCHIMQHNNYSVFTCSSVFNQAQRQTKVFTSGDRHR